MNLKEELTKAKEELRAAHKLWEQSPHYIAAVANVDLIAKQEKERYKSEVAAAEKKYNDLFAQYNEKEKQPDLPTEVKQLFEAMRSGVDWGPVDFRLRYESEDKRFVIITIPGAQYWYSYDASQYGNTRHYLVDLQAVNYWKEHHKLIDGSSLLNHATIAGAEGRLSKMIQDGWILMTQQMTKTHYAPPKDKDD